MFLFRALINNKVTLFFSAAFSNTTHRPYRIAVLITTAALIAWSANYCIQSVKHQKTLQHIADQYGENITLLATEQLTNSVLNNDAISSQAIAHKIALKAGITSVIVYDNKNQILAQSIKPIDKKNVADNKEYTAPIVSSENIIGSTSITINTSTLVTNTPSPAEWFWSEWLVIASLLLCLVFFFIKDATQPRHNKELPKNKSQPPKNITPNENHTTDKPTHTITSQHSTIYLTITVHNIDTLYRQLNGELRQQQMELLEKNIQHTTKLYDGKKLIADNNTIIFLFNDGGKNNIANAIYSAQLLIALHQQCKKSMITMSGLIQESSKEQEFTKTLDSVRTLLKNQSPYSSHIETAVIEKYQLDQRIKCKEKQGDDFATEITGLTSHYQQLLDNQLAQLLKSND